MEEETTVLYKQKTVQVDPETYKKLTNILGRKFGRVSEKDTDKDLELNLCRYAFTKNGITAKVESAGKNEDIKHDVDCIVNGIYKVQVKCRKNGRLYLEDYKTRNNRKYPGWLDRSKADLFVFAWPESNCNVSIRLLKSDDLKRLLKIYRQNESREKISSEDLAWIKNWGGIENYAYHAERMSNDKDGYGSYFEVNL